ncbi:FAD-dependent oxidoreductase [Prauserella flavalba]|uniref:FAD-dependent oxidoreductase n=1 Tax=Prauserella flavalba TaxID=1477506 RepID=UPI0036EFCA0F
MLVEFEPGWGEEWDGVADVVVVGSGAAGLAAGVTAASRDRSVIMLERAAFPGGTTAKSSATMWIPDNPLLRDAGLTDERSAALRFMARAAYPVSYCADAAWLGLTERQYRLLEALYDHGRAAFTALDALGGIPYDRAAAPGFPDYHADFPEDTAPVGRSVRMRYPEGHRPGIDATGGQLFVDAMLAAGTPLGLDLRTGHRAHRILADATGAVVGVEARTRNSTVLIGARRGVVFATGGFLHDPVLAQAFLRGPVLGGAAAEEATGDFVRMGIEVGAQLGNMTHAWWDEVVVEDVLRRRSTSRDAVYLYGDSMIVVNRFGRRVMNEKMPYNERGQVHFTWDPDRREYPNLLLFLLFDDAVLRDTRAARHRYPVPGPADGHENLISADTWDELALAIDRRLAQIRAHTGGVRLDAQFTSSLRATLARYDALARAGRDEDHHRGETPIERAWATEPRGADQTNPTLHPFSPTGPYHCVLLGPGALDTKGGPVVDERARVLGTSDEPIRGLYGAGNCVASPCGQGYFGPGGTVGPAITFGYLAGLGASAEETRSPKW